MSSPFLSSSLTTANMSTIDRVLAKAGIYQLHAVEDLPTVVSATKFLIGRVLRARVGEAGLRSRFSTKQEQAAKRRAAPLPR
jgi:hypothetical protein